MGSKKTFKMVENTFPTGYTNNIVMATISSFAQEQQEDLAQKKAKEHNLPYLDMKTATLNIEALRVMPEVRARQAHALVFDKKTREFSIASPRPDSPEVQDLVKEIKKFGTVHIYVVSEQGFEQFLQNYQFIPATREAIVGSVTIGDKYVQTCSDQQDIKTFLESHFTSEFDTSEMLVWILAYGLASNASDLHIEPTPNAVTLRYRIDGVLYPIANLPKNLENKIIDRVKLLSKINLNIKNIPQDGRFSIRRGAYEMEMRVSTIPGPDGENIVMRFLNPNTIGLGLEELGLREYDKKIIEQELKKPNGLILAVGPTGSGKTTTLYACLKKVSTKENKAITLEDPIEYKLSGVEQTQINAKEGYTFASGLRAILRQDPDIIYVGEIRDQETAEIAMHASLTGHLVFSTLHTNDASGTIPRLLDFKIKPEIIASALNLIIAQRLVRKLCQECAQEIPFEKPLKTVIANILKTQAPYIENLDTLVQTQTIKQARGCDACGNKGYKGRIGVFELIHVNDTMQECIHASPDELKIKDLSRSQGTISLMADALIKVLQGLTDIAEVEKAVGPVE